MIVHKILLSVLFGVANLVDKLFIGSCMCSINGTIVDGFKWSLKVISTFKRLVFLHYCIRHLAKLWRLVICFLWKTSFSMERVKRSTTADLLSS